MKSAWLLAMGLAGMALSAATTMSANAQDTPELAPSTPWNLHYDTDSCALRRMFGEGERQAYVELRRFDRAPTLQAAVGSNWMKATRRADLRYRFGGGGDWSKESSATALTMGEGFSGVLFFPTLLPDFEEIEDPAELDLRLREIDWQAMEKEAGARVDTLAVSGAFNRTIALKLGSLEQPVAALNRCIDELMTHWGIDVEAHKTLTRGPLPINVRRAQRMIDYPPQMLHQGTPGVVNIRLSIDETGGITACQIQMPLSDPAFEKTSCANIQRALKFEPALDKDGKPIASYWTTRVVFQITH